MFLVSFRDDGGDRIIADCYCGCCCVAYKVIKDYLILQLSVNSHL